MPVAVFIPGRGAAYTRCGRHTILAGI